VARQRLVVSQSLSNFICQSLLHNGVPPPLQSGVGVFTKKTKICGIKKIKTIKFVKNKKKEKKLKNLVDKKI
jgi:hypothetical protein